MLCCITLHYCDISCCAKKWAIYKSWIDLLFEEFYAMGDKMRKKGLPVAAAFDRENHETPPAKAQQGFINYFVHPLFDAYSDLYPNTKMVVRSLDKNKEYLKFWEEASDTFKQTY